MSISTANYRKVYYDNLKQYEEPKESFKALVEVIKADREDPFSLVDVGCAAGAFLHYAKNELPVSKCTGIDISDVDLDLARRHVEGVEFVQDSITTPTQTESRQFDVCTCLGTVAVFDDPDPVLQNLIRLVRPGGALYLWDLVNDHPVDVVVRYRRADQPRCDWYSGLNVRSKETFEHLIEQFAPAAETDWFDFRMPFPIPQGEDPLRTWTIPTEDNPHQIVVGTGQMLDFKILRARIPEA